MIDFQPGSSRWLAKAECGAYKRGELGDKHGAPRLLVLYLARLERFGVNSSEYKLARRKRRGKGKRKKNGE